MVADMRAGKRRNQHCPGKYLLKSSCCQVWGGGWGHLALMERWSGLCKRRGRERCWDSIMKKIKSILSTSISKLEVDTVIWTQNFHLLRLGESSEPLSQVTIKSLLSSSSATSSSSRLLNCKSMKKHHHHHCPGRLMVKIFTQVCIWRGGQVTVTPHSAPPPSINLARLNYIAPAPPLSSHWVQFRPSFTEAEIRLHF